MQRPFYGSTFRARSSKRWSALRGEATSRRASALSAIPILADQIFRGWIKRLGSLFLGQCRQLQESLPVPLTGITATGLLQVAESLLAQAAPVTPGPELQDLVQRIGEIADLQGCHGVRSQALLVYMRSACTRGLCSGLQLPQPGFERFAVDAVDQQGCWLLAAGDAANMVR